MRATPGACIKPGCLARRPLCHKVNLPASCSEAQRLFSSMLFIRKNVTKMKSIHSTKLLEKLLHEPHTHSTEGFDDSLERCEIERCSVSEQVFKHNHCAPAFTTKMWSWVVL